MLTMPDADREPIPFYPAKQNDKVVFKGPIGDVLELTETGLVLRGAKIAPFVLERQSQEI